MPSQNSGFYGINTINVHGETSDRIYCSLFDNSADDGASTLRAIRYATIQETFPMAVRSDGADRRCSYIRTPVAGIYQISAYVEGGGNAGALLITRIYARSNVLFDSNGWADTSALTDPNVRILTRGNSLSAASTSGTGGIYLTWTGFIDKDQYIFNTADFSGASAVLRGNTYSFLSVRCIEPQEFPLVNAQ